MSKRNDNRNSCLVSLLKSSYDDVDIHSLVEPFGGIKSVVSSGDRVLLKVNLLNASAAEKHVCTHPLVVKAIAQEVLDVGGVPFIGDSPGGPFTKRRLEKVYRQTGMAAVASELGIELNYDTSSQKVSVDDGVRVKKIPVCNFYTDADATIAVPKLKTHSLMMMTLACKIMYGVIPGLSKAKYHSTNIKRELFADMLVDVLAVTAADLYIMDGIIGMQGDGPAGGDPVELGVLFASINPVALDLSVCRMLGIEPVGIPVLKQAKIRGLWPSDITYPLETPEDVAFQGFELPATAGYALTGKKKPKKSPVIMQNCIGCGQCEQICPRSTVHVVNGKAVIEYSGCIRCFCCHEICPVDAIDLDVVK